MKQFARFLTTNAKQKKLTEDEEERKNHRKENVERKIQREL